MNAMIDPVRFVRAIAVATVLLVIVLMPQHADAQCAISYSDAYEDGAYVYGWNAVMDYYNGGGCMQQGYYWWGFYHDYYASTTVQSPSGRTAAGGDWSSAWGGGGYASSLSVLLIEDEFGNYTFFQSVAIFCSYGGGIYQGGGGSTVTVAPSFPVRLQAFIPWAWVSDGTFCYYQIVFPLPTIVKGDNRTTNDRNGSYRIRHDATLRPGLGSAVEGAKSAGETVQHEQFSSVGVDTTGGVVPEADSTFGDCFKTHSSGFADMRNVTAAPSGNAPAKWAKVQFDGAAAEPINPLAPTIDWAISVKVSTASGTPSYEVVYTHDCFPAFEVWIGPQLVYPFNPTSRSFPHIAECLFRLPNTVISGSASGSLN